MANDQGSDTQNSNPQGGYDEGGEDRKLFAGKFKDPEDAYKGLEKGFHETRQEVKQIRELLEAYKPREQYDEGYNQQQGYIQHPASEGQGQQGVETLTRFYQNPDQVLSSVEDRAARRAAEQLQRQQADNQAMQRRVATWSEANPDVAVHQDMLTYWVQQTDGRLSPETRLDIAAKKVRERLTQLRKAGDNPSPRPGDYVEAPDGGQPPRGKQPPRKPTDNDPESQLKRYAAQRNSSRLNFPGKK